MRGSFDLKTSRSRSSASLCFVTFADHRRFVCRPAAFDDFFGVLLIGLIGLVGIVGRTRRLPNPDAANEAVALQLRIYQSKNG